MTDYRYSLTRSTYGLMSSGRLCWVMLNPSTADDTVDDPTIRRVIRFTRDAGYADLTVVNLFAARATNPKHLYEHDDPVGPTNGQAMLRAFTKADAVVFAWGTSGGLRAAKEAAWATWRADELGHHPLCLGTTAAGSPRHPLYVAAAQPLVRWSTP